MIEKEVEQTIANQSWIDQAADPLQRGVRAVLDRTPTLASVLHGDFLGHPLHAIMTDIPIGSWSAAIVMDIFELTGSKKLRRAADVTTTIGLVGALGAVLPGLADWSTTRDDAKR